MSNYAHDVNFDVAHDVILKRYGVGIKKMEKMTSLVSGGGGRFFVMDDPKQNL